MKFNFSRFFKKDAKGQVLPQKDLVITIHGFGFKTMHEFDPLAEYLEKEGFEVWQFSYFNPNDPDDTDISQWMRRCETRIQQAIAQRRTIHLVGFSMGGIIASHLASIYSIEDLLLAAPAFYPFDFNQVSRVAKNKIMPKSDNPAPSMSGEHTKGFVSVVQNFRDDILKVKCPIFILHGTGDEVVQYKSSRKIFNQIPNKEKALVFLHHAKHRFLYDGPYQSLAFSLIRDYFRHEIKPQIYQDDDIDNEDDH